MTFTKRLAWIRANAVKAEALYARLIKEIPVLKAELKALEAEEAIYEDVANRMFDRYGPGSEWQFLIDEVDNLRDEVSMEVYDLDEKYGNAKSALDNLEGRVEAASYDMVDAIN